MADGITFVMTEDSFSEAFDKINRDQGYGFNRAEDYDKVKGFLTKAGIYWNVSVYEIMEQLMNSYYHSKPVLT